MEAPTTTALQEAIEKARHSARDPETMRIAAERLDAAREALRRKLGHDVDFAVPAIRDLRDDE